MEKSAVSVCSYLSSFEWYVNHSSASKTHGDLQAQTLTNKSFQEGFSKVKSVDFFCNGVKEL
jgi:hypothetical protein